MTKDELDWERVDQLTQERLPCAWIAEDVGASRNQVDKYRKRKGYPTNRDFSEVWGAIRVNPKLLALHREFAPKMVQRAAR